MDATTNRPTLVELELLIARLYVRGLELAGELATTRPCGAEQLVEEILRDTETITQIVQRIDPLDFDLDVALDVAVILSRALNIWSGVVRRWQEDSDHVALAAAARELTGAGLALHDALASGAWLASEDLPVMAVPPRRVQ